MRWNQARSINILNHDGNRELTTHFFSQSVAQSAWPLPHPPTFDLAHQRNSSVDCSRFPSGAKLSRADAARGIGPRRPQVSMIGQHKLASNLLATAMTLKAVLLQNRLNRRNKKVSRLFSCLLYTSPSPRDATLSRMPSSA